jgi:crotonobetainyl-CoA:carnitine CoA-transferase CaiB-like acyl-CoA transferase
MPEDATLEERLPLAGLRVLDCASLLAGPMVSMFLGDLGAEVVKIERPGEGDELRYWGHHKDGVGLYHKVINRNKKSVTADLHTGLGREIVKRLVRDSDVMVENFRPGRLEGWGLGYDVLREQNPGLILLHVTGFGQTGPLRDRPGFGTLAEAFSGFAFVNGYPDRPPMLPGFGLADSTTGLFGAFAVMVALWERAGSGGEGQEIDLAIYEPLFTLLGPHVIDYDQLGIVQARQGSRLPFTAPRNTFRTKDDKWVAIAGSAQSTFERICRALGRKDLLGDPRFADNRERMVHVDALEEALAEAIGRLPLDELLRRFDEHQATVAPVNDVGQIFEDPHYRARENIVAIPDDELGGVRMQNVVGRYSRTPGRIRSAGPRVGAHNREILIERLGFTPEELRAEGLLTPDPSTP